ncbi:hypothetical protein PB01_04190 [Psychrobacillus glaciei]|uniref:Uncharacterized protein n=1 Tax=Psychrobacillus glaciei TaxID=2283160 RepID=A0A5J6SJM2_9BACI|nr:hypothetical protein [Psychrobacillus glaciei]QFF98080.1 hypothetical protein PB01_04190 [Psychrobacillus glaciei]
MVCYAFPFCLEFYISDNSLSKSQVSFAWFICLIPSLIFSYYKGFKGGTFSIIFATLLHVFTRVVFEKEMMTKLEYYIQVEVIIANILVALLVCFFVNKLQIENTKLEIAYKDLAQKK